MFHKDCSLMSLSFLSLPLSPVSLPTSTSVLSVTPVQSLWVAPRHTILGNSPGLNTIFCFNSIILTQTSPCSVSYTRSCAHTRNSTMPKWEQTAGTAKETWLSQYRKRLSWMHSSVQIFKSRAKDAIRLWKHKYSQLLAGQWDQKSNHCFSS